MNKFLEKFSLMTIVALIIVLVGAYDVLDGTLSPDYKKYVEEVGIMIGLLGIGRGIASAGRGGRPPSP